MEFIFFGGLTDLLEDLHTCEHIWISPVIDPLALYVETLFSSAMLAIVMLRCFKSGAFFAFQNNSFL